jgi:type I restriction enzyme S subunit
MTNAQFLQQFGHFIDAPNGIRKLREMILQLAVQGKLVDQSPADESGHELLENINSKKLELLKAKAIKTGKKLPPPSNDELPFTLPDTWAWARLGHVTNYGSTDKAEAKDVTEDTWVLELEDVEKSTSRLWRRTTFKARQFKSSKNRFDKGDVIYGKLRPYLDKVLVADRSGVCTTEMIPIRGYHAIKPEYLRWYLKSPYFIQYANSSTHGMNLPRMGTDKARMALCPIPPLAEQHRIVAKVDELMTLCDQLEAERNAREATHQRLIRAVHHPLTEADDANATSGIDSLAAWHRIRDNFADLYTTLDSVQALRQTILQLAVQGKLVSQDTNDEPAETFLHRTKEKKLQMLKDDVIKKGKALPSLDISNIPYELPEGWEWTSFDDIVNIVGGVTKGRKLKGRTTGSFPYLRVANVQRGWLNLAQIKEIEIPLDELEKYSLKEGDLLITEGGDWDKVGRTAIWHEEISPCLHQNHVFRARVIDDTTSRHYLMLYLNSKVSRDYFAGSSKQTTNLASINMTQLRSAPMPVPPTAEQHRIVAKVDELMTLCDQLEANIREKNDTATRYAEAVVAQIAAA